MSALRSAFGKRDAAIFPGALAVPVPGSFRSSSSGADVTDQTALSLMTFFAGVRIIADSITFLPLRAVKILPDGTRSPLPCIWFSFLSLWGALNERTSFCLW